MTAIFKMRSGFAICDHYHLFGALLVFIEELLGKYKCMLHVGTEQVIFILKIR